MSKYIDADTLKQTINDNEYLLSDSINSLDYGMFTVGIMQAIDEQPTADVVEVVHGEWIAEEIHNCWTEFECSVCKFKHKSVHDFGKPMIEFNYCPNCGADMRGEDDDD